MSTTTTNRHPNTLLLVGGAAGTGKTSLAQVLSNPFGDITQAPVISADDYFYDETGAYNFVAGDLPKAHQRCQHLTKRHMLGKEPLVIVTNTFTNRWEVQPYAILADENDYQLFFVSLGDSGLSPTQLAERNVHGVPVEGIERMLGGDSIFSYHHSPVLPPWERG